MWHVRYVLRDSLGLLGPRVRIARGDSVRVVTTADYPEVRFTLAPGERAVLGVWSTMRYDWYAGEDGAPFSHLLNADTVYLQRDTAAPIALATRDWRRYLRKDKTYEARLGLRRLARRYGGED